MNDLNNFIASFPSELIFENEPMKNHVSFKAGGTARLMFVPDNTERLRQAITLCRSEDINFYVVGNCTNLLVRDIGFDGVIIKIGKDISDVEIISSETPDVSYMYAQSGALLGELSTKALEEGLSGLEFASGIPGTLGGAVFMNAGAYNSEMKDIVVSADVLDKNGRVIKLQKSELEFGYRASKAQKEGFIVLSSVLELVKKDKSVIKNKIDELAELRKQKQPLDLPSAGSAFKRPKGFYSGKLISDAGLKGYTYGGAQVSEKHAGFIVNHNNASAGDIIRVIEHVILTVREKFGCTLEPEIKIIP